MTPTENRRENSKGWNMRLEHGQSGQPNGPGTGVTQFCTPLSFPIQTKGAIPESLDNHLAVYKVLGESQHEHGGEGLRWRGKGCLQFKGFPTNLISRVGRWTFAFINTELIVDLTKVILVRFCLLFSACSERPDEDKIRRPPLWDQGFLLPPCSVLSHHSW